jgi:hypothetical protein
MMTLAVLSIISDFVAGQAALEEYCTTKGGSGGN